jgi:hypothetical protein
MRVKAKRREAPPLPPEYVYAYRDEGGRWTVARAGATRRTLLSEAQFLAEWQPLGHFDPYEPPHKAPSPLRELARAKADAALVALINWANRMRRATAPAPETYVPKPGIEEQVLLAPPTETTPAPVAGEVVIRE